MKYFNQAIDYIKENEIDIDLTLLNKKQMFNIIENHSDGGCPGSKAMSFNNNSQDIITSGTDQPSTLNQWPVQLHLLNPLDNISAYQSFLTHSI